MIRLKRKKNKSNTNKRVLNDFTLLYKFQFLRKNKIR
jgi:hypothetical protein